ncbi:MAG: glycosyltransferase [Candidatus Omnitrophica bacterium]|nr:glycosyltransferase [Candidatus Omnitrophota bacterium]
MNILMMTNTYKPILGGLEKSVEAFTKEFRRRGHRVLIITPEYDGAPEEEDVIRIPAMQKFNGSDFSIQLPVPGVLEKVLEGLRPDIIHTHHPFLIGDTALRLASKYNTPVVFTHHTLYEENVHYVPGNQEALRKFVIELSTGYANLADQVIAPSESVMQMMQGRGVQSPIHVVPTGIYEKNFSRGARLGFRGKFKIPKDAFVVGHLGRLAPEKNLEFVAKAVSKYLRGDVSAHCMIAGKGPSEEMIQEIFRREGVIDRLHMVGVVKGKDLVDAYHAMDVFAFASQSETQGLVLTEAMAAGVPVVGVDAPGVREVVRDKVNGRLLMQENLDDFFAALAWMKTQSPEMMKKMNAACRQTAHQFSMESSVDKISKVYLSSIIDGFVRKSTGDNFLSSTLRLIEAQWRLTTNLSKAAVAMMTVQPAKPVEMDEAVLV